MSQLLSVSGGRLARRSLVNAGAAALALASANSLGAALVDFGDVSLTTPPAAAYAGPGGGVYYNGSDGAGSIASGGVSFNNNYDSLYGSWDGFAYSTTADTETAGYGNQYSAYTSANSGAYAVAYPGYVAPATITFATDVSVASVDLANTAYSFLSMRDGDGFAKKFGGVSGADADWFTVTFTGYDAFDAVTGVVTFYLADYRFADDALDYIVDDWTTVDLSGLGGGVRSIELSWDSSDKSFGYVNTPTYVALDNLAFSAVPEPSSAALLVGAGALAACGVRRRRRSVAAA